MTTPPGDKLVAPLNAPPAGNAVSGVQPGVTGGIVLANIVVIFGPTGSATGLFVYQPGTTPGAGNPPIAWITANAKDPYGNTLTPGIMLAEASGTGNAEGGIVWNSAVPGAAEPLLALYPNATVGFTGNSPFVLGRVFNRGLANERLGLASGGGGTHGSSPTQMELFSQSADGSLLGHISFYDWATTNLMVDINASTLVTAADPNSANTNETWHAMSGFGTGFSAGTPAPKYKKYPDDTVALAGEINVTSGTTNGTIVTLPGLPYNPPSTKKYAIPISAGTPSATANVQITIDSSADIILSAGPTGSAYSIGLDGIRYPLDY